MILSICDNLSVLQATLIIKTIIKIICILAPIILIITSIVSLTKAVLNNDENAIKSAVSLILVKFVVAALIFMVPTAIYAIANLASPNSNYRKCINNATKERIDELKIEEASNLVETASKKLTSADYTVAYNSVNKLKNSSKKSSLLQKLESIKKDVETKEKVLKLIKEGTEESYNSALIIVNSLTNSELKADLTNQLAALRKQLDMEKDYVLSGKTDDNSELGNNNTYVSGDLEVHFINPSSRVDAIFIRAGDKSIYIDGGFKRDSKKEIAYLDKIGVTHIDYYIGSHAHQNHVEAAPPIIQKYGIKNVIVGREKCKGSGSMYCSWYAINVFAKEQKIDLSGVTVNALQPGDTFTLNGMKITCVGPLEVNNSLNRGDTAQNKNSIIFRLDYGNISFMFTGDNSSSANIKASYKQYSSLMQVDVLKNAHHNGNLGTKSYQIFNPKYVVFTTDSEHLPSSECLNNVKSVGAKYFIVADNKNDNVVFTTDGNTINVTPNYTP